MWKVPAIPATFPRWFPYDSPLQVLEIGSDLILEIGESLSLRTCFSLNDTWLLVAFGTVPYDSLSLHSLPRLPLSAHEGHYTSQNGILMHTMVPIGTIYLQLPNTMPPSSKIIDQLAHMSIWGMVSFAAPPQCRSSTSRAWLTRPPAGDRE